MNAHEREPAFAHGAGRKPEKVWVHRKIDPEQECQARSVGLTDLQARILASRVQGMDEGGVMNHFTAVSLQNLSDPFGIPDMEAAAHRIVMAITLGETIALSTDHDCDGVTSHAILYRALVECLGHPMEKIQSFIGHRLREGYGLSDSVADRILGSEPGVNLVITADNGSADEARIKRLAACGVDTIVTDHHAIPEAGGPESAVAFVSPTREDSRYGDPAIAGCMVAWLLMMATFRIAADMGREMPTDARSKLTGMLAEVAAGTVADCVTLGGSINNRIAVIHGLHRMNHPSTTRPCWRVAARHLTKGERPLNAEDLAFGVGPRINARGRLDEAMAGVRFLLAETEAEAEEHWALLEQENEARKQIEATLKERAMKEANTLVGRGEKGVLVWLPDGHPGVHGIVASRVVEAFGVPVLCVSPVFESEAEITGSARGVEGFDVAEAFNRVANRHPELLRKHGGHQGAGGLRLHRDGLDALREAWGEACAEQVARKGIELYPSLEIEKGGTPPLTVQGVDEIEALGPYGRGFPEPLFLLRGTLTKIRRIGDGSHLMFQFLPRDGGMSVRAVWFGALQPGEDLTLRENLEVELAGRIKRNHYMGQVSVQIQVEAVRKP
ncbi:DHH family phosphoesterase [Thioalkalivibrio sp. ALE16]|uniref:single-stranded-DNA-specific exonuclease RecJ n=1 Tax=Thioalkalivibrio sp. ALE16 TaxID=1158172 RepID=UPI00037A0DE3|nr:DHH family phosphoesterase [Thioalkalivibrio sp. ALE16]